VPYYHAILGGKIKVTTAQGRKGATLEPGTQPDQEYILANEGVPDKSGRYRGDLHVTIKVDLPSKLSPQERKFLEEIRKLHEGDNKKRFGLFN